MTTARSNIASTLLLVVALLITFLTTLFIERFYEHGDELIVNKTFREDLKHWKLRGNTDGNITVDTDGVLHLQSSTKKYVSVSQMVQNPPIKGFLKLSAYISTRDIVPGPKGWNKARLILDRRDSSGQGQKLPHHAASIDGTTKWEHYDQVFRLVPDTSRIFVTAGLARASGSMNIRNISLKQVSVSSLFIKIRPIIFIGWAIIVIWLLTYYINRRSDVLISLLTVLVLSAIVAGTLTPAVSKSKLQGTVKEYVMDVGTQIRAPGITKATRKTQDTHPYDVYINHVEIGKIGHFILFGMFAFLLLASRSKIPVHLVISDIVLLAGATETLQFFTEGRSPMLYDFGLDLGGVLTGLVVFVLLTRHSSRPKRRLEIPADI